MSEFGISPLRIPSGESQSKREGNTVSPQVSIASSATMIFSLMTFFNKQLRAHFQAPTL